MTSVFPEVKILVKGEGKQKQVDKDFFKECNQQLDKVITDLLLEYEDVLNFIKSENTTTKEQLSVFYSNKLSYAYNNSSCSSIGLPIIDDIVNEIIKLDLELIDNCISEIVSDKLEEISSEFSVPSEFKVTYSSDKDMEYNNFNELKEKIYEYKERSIKVIKEDYQIIQKEMIKYIVHEYLKSLNLSYGENNNRSNSNNSSIISVW